MFDLLADVPRSAGYFPKMERLTDLGGNTFRWEMEKIGLDKHSLQTVYACTYTADKASSRIAWVPVKNEGNSLVSGSWQFTRIDDNHTRAKFYTEAEMTLPLPGLLKLAISPVVKHEFNAMVDIYVKNLQKFFAG